MATDLEVADGLLTDYELRAGSLRGRVGFRDAIVAALAAARAEGRNQGRKDTCPFDGPHDIEPDVPCPVCGILGNDPDNEDACPIPIRSRQTPTGTGETK